MRIHFRPFTCRDLDAVKGDLWCTMKPLPSDNPLASVFDTMTRMRIVEYGESTISVGFLEPMTYQEAFDQLQKINGDPFGVEQPNTLVLSIDDNGDIDLVHLSQQIRDYTKLEDEWMGKGSRGVSQFAINNAVQFLSDGGELPPFHTPTLDGGVQFEYRGSDDHYPEGTELELEFFREQIDDFIGEAVLFKHNSEDIIDMIRFGDIDAAIGYVRNRILKE